MNIDMQYRSAVLSACPDADRRACRLFMAVQMLRRHLSPREVQRHIRGEYGCSRATAWRVVSMAQDLA